MRKALIFGIFFMSLAMSLTIVYEASKPSVQPIINLRDELMESPLPPQVYPKVIDEFNEINDQIISFDASDAYARMWEKGLIFRIYASVIYEKPMNFRMRTWSTMGNETDIGSNNQTFWYWSRRDKHPGLYYSSHEDYYKTRLKTPFNPVFLRESLGLDKINPKEADISENDSTVMLSWKRMNATGQKVLYSVFLNKKTKRMEGIVISDMMNNLLATCQIEYKGYLPKTIIYKWHEENRSLVLEFNNPTANKIFNKNEWRLPEYSPKINMGEE